nr:uncharacterized protein LOC123493395 [Aegilops tauschii subsp. strangulata]
MWKIDSMKATVLQDMFADVSTSKCKHAKKLVMDRLMCGMKNEYTRVFDYQLELLRSNPGSTIAVCLDPTNMDQNIFQSFYVCFNAMKLGFKAGCRKVIGLDGCFFKGAVKGELLCAIARDANNQMYPVAWAVVEKETKESWKWFVGLLIKDLDINNNGAGWVVISDQQKGLINAMQDYLPNAEHRMCARHIYANWRKKHRSHEWQKFFWAIAKASNKQDFNYRKAKLAQETPDGVKDIMRTEPMHWARAFFQLGSNCESVDNNLCESFNHSIVDARFYPIISMQERIRKKILVRVQEQRAKSEKWNGTICPSIFKKLKASIARTQFVEVLWNGPGGFEVKHINGRGRQYTPVEGEEMWPVSPNPRPQAPGYVKMPGRPSNNDRKREETEKPKGKKMSKHGTVIKCSLCGIIGHNKASCKKNPERGKKNNAHLVKSKKAEQAQGSTTQTAAPAAPTSQPAAPATPRTHTAAQAAPRSSQAAAPTAARTAQAAAPSNKFKPPRKRSAPFQPGASSVPGGTSSSSLLGTNASRTGAKRGRGRSASSVPSYAYFTCSGNY